MKSALLLTFIAMILFSNAAYSRSERLFINSIDIGLRVPFSIPVKNSSNTDLSFTNSDGGLGLGVGLVMEWSPIKYLTLESGISYRHFIYGKNSDIILDEIQFPLLAKARIPISRHFSLFIGGGASFFHQYSGSIDINDTVSPNYGQTSISLPKSDLRSDWSLILKAGTKYYFSQRFYWSFEMGYEKANRSLNMESHDLTLAIGIGLRIY